jgi:hypothetical protein
MQPHQRTSDTRIVAVVSLGTSGPATNLDLAPLDSCVRTSEADSTMKEIEVAVLEGLRMQDPISAAREFLNSCKNGTVHECARVLR